MFLMVWRLRPSEYLMVRSCCRWLRRDRGVMEVMARFDSQELEFMWDRGSQGPPIQLDPSDELCQKYAESS
ncbi:hypothetical protein QJS04_geneDACA023378 [Acorus gramineus]|uniref:Uncharacterized protein n=1 Tax=Acorus gramineus TaxID=55184 RepID=A0AAV9A8B1_ACOGR|nr:hypothetical protein QJS04_geneDACA023378 [Acorus gramineus]